MNEKIAFVLMDGPDMACRMVHAFVWALDMAAREGGVKTVLEGETRRWG